MGKEAAAVEVGISVCDLLAKASWLQLRLNNAKMDEGKGGVFHDPVAVVEYRH